MNTGYYQATGGMVTQMNRLNTITNNLANLNTNGYKPVMLQFVGNNKQMKLA